MKRQNKISLLISIIILSSLMFLSACAGNSPKPKQIETVMQTEFKDAPEWVTKGCSQYFSKKSNAPVICAVGSIGGTRNVSLARTTSESRAKTAIARKIQSKITAMLKDYQASTTGGQDFGTSVADEQHIVDVSKQIAEMTISGAEPVEYWISPNGTYYTLVEIDSENFKNSVDKIKTLSEAVRRAIEERADKAFSEMNEETGNTKEE